MITGYSKMTYSKLVKVLPSLELERPFTYYLSADIIMATPLSAKQTLSVRNTVLSCTLL